MRMQASYFRVNAERLIRADAAGLPLQSIFQLSQQNGISLAQMDQVRLTAVNYTPVPTLPGAIVVWNSLIQFALATQALIIANTTFISRNEVEVARQIVQTAFPPMQEIIADQMDSVGYMMLTSTYAAIISHLTNTERPLPKMLTYRFAAPQPTLVYAYKLYADAGRADELRDENDIVHPAFAPMTGQALSR
jgi:hypothetical protein